MPSIDDSITARAAAFAAALTYDELPQDAIAMGKRCLVDGLGLFVAGTSEDSVSILIEDAREQGGKAEALLLGGGGLRVPAAAAARVLGTAGHAHDWDDTQVSHDEAHIYGLLTHPTIPPLAAGPAAAQALGGVSGKDFMTAFQAGFEASARCRSGCCRTSTSGRSIPAAWSASSGPA
jgi:2-methylcitrate dehydratase PrpD